MRRAILLILGAMMLASSGLCDDWTKAGEAHFGRAQELSVWTNDSLTRVFLADSTSQLYTKSEIDTTWFQWLGECSD